MNKHVPKWARGTFELIQHGQQHVDIGGDFDRRIAFISFDNAIEAAITTYLELNPSLRGGRIFLKEDVKRWTANYHTKIEFFCEHAEEHTSNSEIFSQDAIYYHGIRNEMYHYGKSTVPNFDDVYGIRGVALKVFSVLFDIDAEKILEDSIDKPETTLTSNELTPQTVFLQNYVALEQMLRDRLLQHKDVAEIPKNASLRWQIYNESYGLTPPSDYTRIINEGRALRNKMLHGQEDEPFEAISTAQWVELSNSLIQIREFVSN